MTTRRVSLLAAVAVGALLRAWQLGAQVVEDDEFHGLQASAYLDAADLLARRTPHGFALDYSIPLALWNRLLLSTTGLDEWGLRLPVLLAGIALVPLVSLWVWRWVGPFEGVLTAWLLAISPPLVLYSRFARPYGAVALLVFGCLAASLQWQRDPRARWGLASALSGAAAVFANLVAAPAVLAIWGLALGLSIVDGRREPGRALRWTLWAALGGLLTLVLLAPGFDSWQSFIERKAQRSAPELASWWGAAQVLFGSQRGWLVMLYAALALVGTVVAWRRAPRFAVAVAATLAAQLAALFAVAPFGWDQPIVLGRYLLVAFLGVQALAALGLAVLSQRAAAGAAWPAAGVLVLFFAAGPLPALYAGADSYTSHRFRYAPPEWKVRTDRVPGLYARLAEGTGPLFEAPWTLEWDRTVYGDYQRVHRRPVRTLTSVRAFAAEGLHLRTVLPLRRLRDDFAGIGTLVVHKDIVAEWFHVTAQSDPAVLTRWTTAMHRDDAAEILATCRQSPALRLVHEDERLAVFERR